MSIVTTASQARVTATNRELLKCRIGRPAVRCASTKQARTSPAELRHTYQVISTKRELMVALTSAALSVTGASEPPPSEAVTTVFAGLYDDPNHPGCPRTIDVTGKIEGVDPVPFKRGAGCSKGTKLSPPWTIQGKIDEEAGTIFIDFDQKDGSGEAFLGKWTGSGIELPDGTVWSKRR
eukprot:CAMPEP_0177774568 /NCGR_PEP_ID=MMETSP0491_2-20121128/13589_1 /TAXON_ID=63592 /ORGANISM="Tetraselmis chuii, Strain PLY429" /LENGTH=178 /DNA_ID=CAMNT_0019292981 /DNA_START=171 /DNA_END=707 /DNA_ORIENTATION=-